MNPNIQNAQSQLNNANTNLQNAQSAYNGFNVGSNYIDDALKQAILNKFNNNQDLISDKNNALNDYLNAPINAHNNFNSYYNAITGNNPSGVVNPYVANDYVQNQTNNAYTKYNNYNDLMNSRVGTINDLINSGKNLYNAQGSNIQGALTSAQQAQQAAAQTFQNYQQQALIDAQANQANALAHFYNGGGGYGSSATPSPQFGDYWNAYTTALQNNKTPNNNPYQVQDNLYKYLMSGGGVGLPTPIKQQFWNQWQQLQQQYLNSINQKKQQINNIPSTNTAYSGPTFGQFLGGVGNLGSAADKNIRGFFGLPANNGYGL